MPSPATTRTLAVALLAAAALVGCGGGEGDAEKLTEGEVEERDAESNWTGKGYTGRWAIREVAGCPEQTSVTVLAAKA